MIRRLQQVGAARRRPRAPPPPSRMRRRSQAHTSPIAHDAAVSKPRKPSAALLFTVAMLSALLWAVSRESANPPVAPPNPAPPSAPISDRLRASVAVALQLRQVQLDLIAADAAARNDSNTTRFAAMIDRGSPSWLSDTAKSSQQLFFLAMPSTASSTLDHALRNMARAFAEARAGEDGDALAATARGRCQTLVEERHADATASPNASACAGRDARALARHLDLGYRGKVHMQIGPSLVRTFAENALRKEAAERRPEGAAAAPAPLFGEALLVRSASQRVRVAIMLRAPEAWARSVARRFWGADPSDEARFAAFVEGAHWLWNAHARMLSGNFTRFSSEVLVANASADPDGRPWKAPHATAPSRAQALAWSAPPAPRLCSGLRLACCTRRPSSGSPSAWPTPRRSRRSPSAGTPTADRRFARTPRPRARALRERVRATAARAAAVAKRYALDLSLYDRATQLFDRRISAMRSLSAQARSVARHSGACVRCAAWQQFRDRNCLTRVAGGAESAISAPKPQDRPGQRQNRRRAVVELRSERGELAAVAVRRPGTARPPAGLRASPDICDAPCPDRGQTRSAARASRRAPRRAR